MGGHIELFGVNTFLKKITTSPSMVTVVDLDVAAVACFDWGNQTVLLQCNPGALSEAR